MGAQQVACATKAPPWLRGARRFYGWWCGYLKTKPTDVTIEHDRRTWQGEAWNVVVANAQFTDGGIRLSPRSFPGDGVLDALVFTGPLWRLHAAPRLFRHGDHVPDPTIKELKARIRFESAPSGRSRSSWTASAGITPATFQIVPRSILLKL